MLVISVTLCLLALGAGANAPAPFPQTLVTTTDGTIRISTPQFEVKAKQFSIRDNGKFWDFRGTEDEPVQLVTRIPDRPDANYTGTRITYSISDGTLVIEGKGIIEVVNRKK